MKIIVIGGVATGASCAARLRRLDETAEIIVLEKGEFISFANCGLPYHISGVIEDREALILQTPNDFNQRFAIDVRVFHEAIAINKEEKTVVVRNRKTMEETILSYDKLVLAMGSEPFIPPMAGTTLPGVFTLRNMHDMDAILNYITTKQVKQAVVVGGGAIGIEVAENLMHRTIATTMVELANHVIAPLDVEMAGQVHHHLIEQGIHLLLQTGVKAIHASPNQNHLLVDLGDATLTTDMVILSIGVRPDTTLARLAGLELTPRGSIVVNDAMQTSDADIYAGGDAVAVKDFVSGALSFLPLAGPANKHGRIIADQIAGRTSTYLNTQGTSILQAFGLTIAMTGANEITLKRNSIPYEKIYLFPNDHASYYPHATSIAMKVLFEKKTGRLLGAQMVGEKGVDKRMDVFATAMRAHLNIRDLKDLELCYSPVYSSAKDPINMVGFLGENILDGLVTQFYLEDLKLLDPKTSLLLDVRTKEEYDEGHLPHAVHIDVDHLRETLGELDQSKPMYLYCEVGIRGYLASRILNQAGFVVYNLSGGYALYRNNLPLTCIPAH